MKIKCFLENIVENIDGSLTYYFKDDCRDYGHKIRTKNELIELSNKSNKGLKVEICQYREQRSLNANDYFHLLVHKLAEHLQMGNDEMKIKMNLEYGTPEKFDETTLFAIQVPKGADISKACKYAKWYKEITDNGITKDCYIIYKETHTLDTKEMARLIDGVVQECQNVGIETKTPDQIAEMMNLWENYEKQKK